MNEGPRRSSWNDLKTESLLGGTVKRRYVYGKNAMVAQIWLTKGAEVAEHVHEAEQITQVFTGALRLIFRTTGQTHDVRACEVIVIPPNVPHAAVALEDTYESDTFSPRRDDWINGTDAYLRTPKR
ncbi:MAG: cupin domain-containing protein [Chloroflexi bacterium]|nr:MAG: cupin domain-containing protein [Chloroflexota bacterium]